MENLNSQPQQPPQQSGEGSSSAAADLEQLALEAEGGGAQLGDPTPEQLAEAAAALSQVPTAELLEQLLEPLVNVAPSIHHGFKAKPVKSWEVKYLAGAYAKLIDHYWPGGMQKWGPVGGVMIATTVVLGPRLIIPPPPPPKKDEPKQP